MQFNTGTKQAVIRQIFFHSFRTMQFNTGEKCVNKVNIKI